MMNKIKAFKVTGHGEGGVIVFAASRGRAKSIALGCDSIADAEFVDLHCCRYPNADDYFEDTVERLCDFWSEAECRFYRDMGWYQFENENMLCTECELFQWDDVPESILEFQPADKFFDEGVCVGCKVRMNKVGKSDG